MNGLPMLYLNHLSNWLSGRQGGNLKADGLQRCDSPSNRNEAKVVRRPSENLETLKQSGSRTSSFASGAEFGRSPSLTRKNDSLDIADFIGIGPRRAPPSAVPNALLSPAVAPMLIQAAINKDTWLIKRIGTNADTHVRAASRFAPAELGTTPLLAAVLSEDLDTVKAVLALHPDIDAPCDNMQYTALMHAVVLGNDLIVEVLLDAGANVQAQSAFGESAYEMAERSADNSDEHDKIFTMLWERSAEP
jgi:hypothetical protein